MNLIKFGTIGFLFLLLTFNVEAANQYKTRYNPYTNKQDFVLGTDNLEVGSLTASSTVTGVTVSATTSLMVGTDEITDITGSGLSIVGGALTASGFAPTTADYLVGTANGSLSAEIVVGATPSGDLGGTWDNISVDDESHNHTTTTISGVDISADTNLTAGDNLTLTDDDLDLDTSISLTSVTASNTVSGVTVIATDATIYEDLTVGGDMTVTDVTVSTGGTLQLGQDGTDGLLKIYSEQGVTDYIASLYSHTAMTSAASFFLPADEPAGTYLLNMTTGGVIGYDSSTYLTAEVDGSITNELPIAGNLIDISGAPASTVDVDLTEANSVTFGSGTFTTMTFDAGATDPVLTMASNVFAVTTGNVGIGTTGPGDKLEVAGAIRVTTGKDFVSGAGARFYKDTLYGAVVQGVTATTNDLTLFGPTGEPLLANPTGTNNVNFTAGNVGIGTTGPTSLLHVQGTANITGAITIAEGALADSTIVSADIKNGEIVSADLSGTAGITLAQTAMTAGRSLTISTNDVAADSECYTFFKAMTIETPTDADNFFFFEAPVAMTITRVQAITEAATSAVITLQECDAAGDNAATIESVTADIDGVISTTIDNGAIDAGDIIRVDVGTVTGTVGQVSVTMTGTLDD